MFLPAHEIDLASLRQGDVLRAVPLPIVDDELMVLGTLDHARLDAPHPGIQTAPRQHRRTQDCFTGQIKMRLSACAVVSHCCELELRHGNPNCLGITVARVIPVKPVILNDADKIASLRANKDPRTDDPGYIDYFYVAPNPVFDNLEMVVDFGQLAAISSAEYRHLLAVKVLQLQDRERLKFKIKLASYLARPTDEEEATLGAAVCENPWADAPVDQNPPQGGEPPEPPE